MPWGLDIEIGLVGLSSYPSYRRFRLSIYQAFCRAFCQFVANEMFRSFVLYYCTTYFMALFPLLANNMIFISFIYEDNLLIECICNFSFLLLYIILSY